MKIFHTADWHLGKLVNGTYMTEDQAYVLNAFVKDIENEQPDVVIIAGDLYDRAIPPPEAVQLLNKTLDEIVLKLNIPVLAIAGNHDSPSRLDFGSTLMRQQGFHVIGTLQRSIEKITLLDEYGPVNFYLIPFADPSIVRSLWRDDTIRTYDDAMDVVIKTIEEDMDKTERNIFVGHAFVTPYGEEKENTSESEKPLSIGGAEYVSATHFEAFDYTALGHLHQSHYVGNEAIRYAGSILKYSLSEQHHKKGYLVIDIKEKGDVTITKQLVTPKRDIRTVKGYLADVLTAEKSDDYIFVELLDEITVLHPMEKIRSVFPNAMQVKRINDPIIREIQEKKQDRNVRELTDVELFQAFYSEIKNEKAPAAIESLFKEMLDEQLKSERETMEGDTK